MEAARIYLDGKGLPGRWLDGMVRRSFDPHAGSIRTASMRRDNLGVDPVPVMIVHGEKDEVVPCGTRSGSRRRCRRGSRTVLRVPGASHSAVLVRRRVGARGRVLCEQSRWGEGEAMKTRTLGRTGIEVSEIGFGAWGLARRCGAAFATTMRSPPFAPPSTRG
jgi:hypothetical protein